MLHEVILPGGESVKVPAVIDDSWMVDGKTGYLDPNLLAPYANQPRTYIDPVKLDELVASIASQGVREKIIITPVKFAPWAAFEPGDEHLPFLIVSGHRRRRSSIAAKVDAVPVEVRIYADEAAFDADAEVLNDHRQNLTELEIGYRLRRDYERGKKVSELMRRDGRTRKWVTDRIFLTFLCPKIRERVSPELKRRDRMANGFAGALGSLALGRKFRFDEDLDIEGRLKELGDKKPLSPNATINERRYRLQHAYLNFCSRKGWKATVSEKFVRTGEEPEVNPYGGRASVGSIEESASEASKMPVGIRAQLIDWFNYLHKTGLLDMTEKNLSKGLSNAVAQDLESFAGVLDMVGATMRKVAETKPRYSDEVLGDRIRLEQKVINKLIG